MKRVAAIVLSLMFLGLQVMSPTPSSLAAVSAGRDCGCARGACCAAAAPASQPPPAAPAPADSQHPLALLAPNRVAWQLPVTVRSVALLDSSVAVTANVPLFTRHCSFLI